MRQQGTVIKRRYYPNRFGKSLWWLVITLEEKRKRITVLGVSDYIPSEGDYIVATGKLVDNGDFKADKIMMMEPQDPSYIKHRLKAFEIFTKEQIEELTTTYGKDIWKKIERKEITIVDPDELYAKFSQWKHRSDKEEAEIELSRYFEDLELPLNDKQAKLFIGVLGLYALIRIKEDPMSLYQLLSVEFLEKYAAKINMPQKTKNDLIFLATFYESIREGKDLCLPLDDFDESFVKRINSLVKRNYLTNYQDFLYLNPPLNSFVVEDDAEIEDYEPVEAKSFFEIEKKTAKMIADLLGNSDPIDYPEYIRIVEENNLSDEQTEALRMFMNNKISLVFGGPGNGKTRMITTIVALAYAVGATFSLVAPTGGAAKVIQEVTNEKTYTIHSFLYSKNVIRGRFLIVDESSMIDSVLFYKLLNESGAERIIMLGDTDQLPPIAAGFPFLQMRKTPVVPRVELTKNFRFDEDSEGIQKALNRILNGNPNLKDCGNGFRFSNTSKVSNILREDLEEYEEFDIDKFRVVTPLRRIVNDQMFNIRELYLDAEDELAVGDWIICRKNLKDLGICNGDIGKIERISEVKVIKEVKCDGETQNIEMKEMHYFVNMYGSTVEIDSRRYFDLAYITTVHSSQGKETDNLIFLAETSSRINTRQLLYTAVSRAKKSVHIIAPKAVISEMINRREAPRYSCLKLMIEEYFSKQLKAIEN